MPHKPTISGRVTIRIGFESATRSISSVATTALFSFAITTDEHNMRKIVRYVFFIHHKFNDKISKYNLAYFYENPVFINHITTIYLCFIHALESILVCAGQSKL